MPALAGWSWAFGGTDGGVGGGSWAVSGPRGRAFRPGKRIQDEVKYPKGSWESNITHNAKMVDLPDQFSAHILVFRVFDEVSYAIIMSGKRPVRERDILKHPDELL